MIRQLMIKIKDISQYKAVKNLLPPFIYRFLHRVSRSIYYKKQIEKRVNTRTIMLADYPRCGIGWLQFTISTVLHFNRCGEFRKLSHEEMRMYAPSLAGRRERKTFPFGQGYNLLKTHHCYVPAFKHAIITYRNPLDAIRSYYAHEFMEQGKIRCRAHGGLTKEECFLIEQSKDYIKFYESWFERISLYPQNYLLVKYEDLLKSPKEMFKKVFAFLQLGLSNLPPPGIDRLIEMYKRTDVSIPLMGKSRADEAFKTKHDIFRKIQPVMKQETLLRLDTDLANYLTTVVEKNDSVRCKI